MVRLFLAGILASSACFGGVRASAPCSLHVTTAQKWTVSVVRVLHLPVDPVLSAISRIAAARQNVMLLVSDERPFHPTPWQTSRVETWLRRQEHALQKLYSVVAEYGGLRHMEAFVQAVQEPIQFHIMGADPQDELLIVDSIKSWHKIYINEALFDVMTRYTSPQLVTFFNAFPEVHRAFENAIPRKLKRWDTIVRLDEDDDAPPFGYSRAP